jgi:transposase
MRPRTKHICIRMHHFREHVRLGRISLHKIPSRYQLADIATKPQPVKLFEEQRESLLQWLAEHATMEELRRQATLLRACGVSTAEVAVATVTDQAGEAGEASEALKL